MLDGWFQMNYIWYHSLNNRRTHSLNILRIFSFHSTRPINEKNMFKHRNYEQAFKNLAYRTSWCNLLYSKLGQWCYRIIITVKNNIKESPNETLQYMVDLKLNQYFHMHWSKSFYNNTISNSLAIYFWCLKSN